MAALKPGIIDPAVEMKNKLRLVKAQEQVTESLKDYLDKTLWIFNGLEVQLKSAEVALNREGAKQIKHNCPLWSRVYPNPVGVLPNWGPFAENL